MDSVVTVDVRHDPQQFPPPLARNNEKVEDALQKHFLTFFLSHPVTAFLELFLFEKLQYCREFSAISNSNIDLF